jgi:hypothetical protein
MKGGIAIAERAAKSIKGRGSENQNTEKLTSRQVLLQAKIWGIGISANTLLAFQV